MAGGPQRLFFALLLPPALRERIAVAAAEVERSHPSGARPTAPDRYHVTLHFLGNHDPVPDALIAAARAGGDATPPRRFEWRLDQAGSFGAGVRWLSGPPGDGLLALHRELGEALTHAGVGLETRPFVPHLTIARGARAPLGHAPIDPLSWHVDGFALVLSRPGRPYEILHRWGTE